MPVEYPAWPHRSPQSNAAILSPAKPRMGPLYNTETPVQDARGAFPERKMMDLLHGAPKDLLYLWAPFAMFAAAADRHHPPSRML